MAGPARTATPMPRRGGERVRARTLDDLQSQRAQQGNLERDSLLSKAFDGKLNVCGTVALTNDGVSTTTDIDDPRIGPNTVAWLESLDAGAAAERGGTTLYQAVNSPGKIRLTHSASATTRTFAFVLLG